jgi:MFS family permease
MTRSLWRVWALSGAGIGLDGFDLFILGVALPLITADLGLSAWEQGLLGAAAVFGAVLGAAVGGRAADLLGRRLLFQVDLAMFVVFALACAFAWDLWSLFVFRLLLGVAVGADYPIAASYVAETMPPRQRQRLLVGAFSFQAVGMLTGALVGVVILLVAPDPDAWRWMLGFGAVPALAIALMRRGMPETPAFTAARQAPPAARPGLRALMGPGLRGRTALTAGSWFLMDVALYGVGIFTPTILALLDLTGDGDFAARDLASTKGSAALDLFLVAGFAVCIALLPRVGAVRLQMAGFATMAAAMALLALGAAPGDGDEITPLVLIGFAVFNLALNAGPNPTTYLMPAEVFPDALRATGHGLAAASGKAGAVVGIFLLPIAVEELGVSATVLGVAVVCLLGLALTAALRHQAADAAPARATAPAPAEA